MCSARSPFRLVATSASASPHHRWMSASASRSTGPPPSLRQSNASPVKPVAKGCGAAGTRPEKTRLSARLVLRSPSSRTGSPGCACCRVRRLSSHSSPARTSPGNLQRHGQVDGRRRGRGRDWPIRRGAVSARGLQVRRHHPQPPRRRAPLGRYLLELHPGGRTPLLRGQSLGARAAVRVPRRLKVVTKGRPAGALAAPQPEVLRQAVRREAEAVAPPQHRNVRRSAVVGRLHEAA